LVAGTIAHVYSLVTSPVAGVDYRFDENLGRVVIKHVEPKGPADLAGLQTGDTLLAFNDTPLLNLSDLNQAYRELEIGQRVELKIRRANREQIIALVTGKRLDVYFLKEILFTLLPGGIFCYALCLIGTFVLLKRIEDRTAHLFYLMVLFWALAMRNALDFGDALYDFLPPKFYWLELPAWPLAVGLLLHFFLVFPIEKKIFQKHPTLLLILIYSPLILIIPHIYADIHQRSWEAKILNYGWGVWLTLNFIIAMIVLAHSIKKAPNPHVKKQAQIMAWGTAISLNVPLFLGFLPGLFSLQKPPYAEFTVFLLILWPVTLAYVIVKHRFMDIDVIVKRGVAYALTSGIVIAAYFFLVVGVGQFILVLTDSKSQMITIIATLLIAALFNPVKNRVQHFVERRFYPQRFTYREAIHAFGHELINVVDLQKLLELLKSFLFETMQIRPVAILTQREAEQKFVTLTIAGATINNPPSFTYQDTVIKLLQSSQHLVDLSPLREQSAQLSEDESQRWQELQTELALPLLSKGKLVGVITLGMKEGDEPYFKEDLDLFTALGDQINVAFTNTLLTEELRKQDRLRRELEVARRIQLSSLPQSDPKIPGLEICGVSIPALEVGGDYYDYISFGDGRFGVVVGDVSGKGTSAALYMSQLKGILQTASKYHRCLKDLIVEVNAIAFQNMELQSYITLMCGAFDVRNRKLSLVRAGHLPLLHYSAQDRICHQLVPRGIGVGLEDGHIFKNELEEIELIFGPGDVFLFYTDGIIEARDLNGNEFEAELLANLIKENGWENAIALREKIISRVQQFTAEAPQKDDMTLVVVKAGLG
jgi:sigma-B regulation protein RsbU (phosphoserine phosphatase)